MGRYTKLSALLIRSGTTTVNRTPTRPRRRRHRGILSGISNKHGKGQAKGGSQFPHRRSLAANFWDVESSHQTRPKPQPQQLCPPFQATRPAVDPTQPSKRAPLGRGA
jgi:hypothetical protein